MAKLNYRGMVNESEIFSRITKGFNKVICESFVKEDGAQEGAAPDGDAQGTDAVAAPAEGGTEGADDDAEAVANATPEQVNGSVTEGKKPMKKLVPEGCCGGKAKKVLKEGLVGSTLGTIGGTIAGGAIGRGVVKVADKISGKKEADKKVNEGAMGSAIGGAAGAVLGGVVGHPVVGAGIGAACGHSLTEDDKEITLQVPGSIKRQNELKNSAAENKAKVGQAIRDGKASFALKEGAVDEGEVNEAGGAFSPVDQLCNLFVNACGANGIECKYEEAGKVSILDADGGRYVVRVSKVA